MKTKSILKNLIIFLLFSFSGKSFAQISNYVEKMPQFTGGEKEMYSFLAKNIRYPADARENNIQGKVIVQFVVKRDGNLDSIKIKTPLGYGCDEEVIRIIKMMPKWEPAMRNDTAVDCYFILPVTFQMSNGSRHESNTDDIEIVISNSDSNETLNEIAQQMFQKDFFVYFKKIKRSKSGAISSIYIHIASTQGSVSGTYKNFSSVKIFRSKEKGIGISPTTLDVGK